ncbi:ArsR/SmtB family transcription factor [Staphylococcus gallinarum]|uniref:ArsR/SmtB family transcription factor n=1 Tax=Staphylococcus gallinarum TaxID=1293 RepID=UPI000D1E7985|nr:metalloregulator ArsR/SmtB family transcription factor [Staphylococcus gallinarum]MCD8785654.1 metalloregulator ArsR/SmtB family transcription factor [Staphylococcus gallinarum]MCD8858365.1 metalloregulator ArsR/SmtB family transcription factor [Staphylococcus gallinarum]PTL16537.1 ArsR family transcriptional regulator [Staphylococcus gallinarum]RIO80620.1 ArsR family transcriptional regulator [Staphylococcus gallinarum]
MEELMSSAQEYKNQLYNQLSKVGKSLSSDKRLELLNLLGQSPKTVERLAIDSNMTVANVSRHLQVLKDAKLVKYTKNKNHIIYSLIDDSVKNFLFLLEKFGEKHISDIEKIRKDFIDNLDDIYTLSMDEVRSKISNNEAILLDLRDKDEFDYEHIENAISVPMEDLDFYLQDLSKSKEIIAYCRGKFCAFSAIATKTLNENGFKAYNMDEGLYEWKQNNNK